ncbi:sensor histidine kinase [Anianabacter salinae]|uniref:sensor histidine kinase n=1 Tax=Anianabacter salinae TaxID=2851023 RepID=UPI00225E6B14|nr:HAMP domain-containing sensor histidine kinase [Anianabacter salinae]MBV0914116.1 HAMP domain-containing histidine kinase [Anianabacter salinae]
MTRRRDLAAYAVAGTAIVAFAILLAFAVLRLAETEAEMRENEGDNMLWVISRAQSAVLLLDSAVARQAGIPEVTADVERRYNVVHSRLTLLSEGPQLRYIQSLGLADDIDAAARATRALEPQILGLSFGATETAASIHETLAPLIAALGVAGNRSMVRQWEATGARVDRQRLAINQVIISIVAIIALGAFLSFTLLRAMVERQRVRNVLSRERETAELYRGFMALISHQFRTPLAVIDSAMQRVLRSGGKMPRDAIEERARQVRAEIRGLTGLLDATLDVVRLEAGNVTAAPADCEIDDLLKRVKQRQLTETPARTLNIRIGDEVPASFTTDPVLAEQILTNLISNAVKYSPETEPISLTVKAESRQIRFAVEDRGIGVPDDEQDKLFSRFFRASTAQGMPGTGVGLSTSYQLARLLGGDLEFVSRSGIGSVFTLKLPAEWAEPHVAPSAERSFA